MDLKLYYQKIRETGSEDHGRVSDGGEQGQRRTAARRARKTEVPRRVAARMIVDGVARQATAEKAKTFRAEAGGGEARGGPTGGGSQTAGDGGLHRGTGPAERPARGSKSRRTDGAVHGREVSTIDDLRGHDTELLEVAETEGIDVTQEADTGAGGDRGGTDDAAAADPRLAPPAPAHGEW